MTSLPNWADNAEARALLAAIRIEQPDCWMLTRYAWTNYRQPRYKGANARAFRSLWEAARDAAMEAGDRDLWTELGHAHPDDIIEAILTERTVPYTRFSIKTLHDGRSQVAA